MVRNKDSKAYGFGEKRWRFGWRWGCVVCLWAYEFCCKEVCVVDEDDILRWWMSHPDFEPESSIQHIHHNYCIST